MSLVNMYCSLYWWHIFTIRNVGRRMSGLQPALLYSFLDRGQVCVRFDYVDHPTDFHLPGSDVMFVRPAVSFLQSLPSDKERMLCSSGKRCPVCTADTTSVEGDRAVTL